MQRLLLGFVAAALAAAAPLPGALLPGTVITATLLAAGLGVALAGCRTGPGHGAARRLLPLLCGALLGFAWAGHNQRTALEQRVATDSSGALRLTVRVVSEPESVAAGADRPPAARFQARVLAAASHPDLAGRRLRLSWYDPPGKLALGQRWALQAIVKRPWSYANPGGFDYERWLLGRGIDGTGWVRGGTLLQHPPPGLLERIRQRLADAVKGVGLTNPGILLALLLGRSGGVPDPVWALLRNTGTVHLMVVSGLHVSLAAAAGVSLAGLLVRLIPRLPLWLNARLAGCTGGIAAAALYALIAGAGLPALRAMLMAGAGLLLLGGGRSRSAPALLLTVLAAVLVAEPLAVHLQGFWLSFAAVTVLILCFTGAAGHSPWRGVVAAQLGLSVGLLPLVALLTGGLPWTSLAANVVAVPAVTLVVVPLVLGGGVMTLIWEPAGAGLWFLADQMIGAVLIWLGWLGQLPGLVLAGGSGALITAQLAGLWWLLRPQPANTMLVLMCAVLPLAPRAVPLPHGAFRVIALDVGQGTAVVIDTRHHRLLYDTGPAYPGGFEAGSAVVVPSLLVTGPPRLDVLVLSHDDLDHTGGADAVVAALPPRQLLRGDSAGAAGCHGRRWTWDGVHFDLLKIPRPGIVRDNDASCILLVDDGRRRLLLAGDISRRVEAALLRVLAASGRPIDLLFAPHHGSVTSSSRALIRVSRPRLVFVSAGYGNRFGHPHPQVLRRYLAIGATIRVTGHEGALMWDSRRPDVVRRWRRDRGPYWRAQLSGRSKR